MNLTSLKNNNVIELFKAAAKETESELYIVGGAIRDIYLTEETSDFDFIVFGDIDRLTQKAAELLNRPVIRIGSGDKKVIRIVKNGYTYDFTPAKGKTLEEDIRRRDFTINALAYSLFDDELLDLAGAGDDIDGKLIRGVSNASIDDDPLRMLRAFRFHALLGFEIEETTLKAIGEKKDKIKGVASERIRVELFKIFSAKDSHSTIRIMADSGLLYEILPELKDSVGCGQNDWHHLDVMEHTLDAYKNLESILRSPHDYFYDIADDLVKLLECDDMIAAFKFAMLLHDVAKPMTKNIDETGRARFFRHAEYGAGIAASIAERLKLSKKDSEFLCDVINQHMRLIPFMRTLDDEGVQGVTKKSVIRYFIRLKKIGIYEILHNLADLMASKGIRRASQSGIDEVTKLSNMMLDVYFNEYIVRKKNPPLVTGSDLIETYGLTPSPLFSEILDTLYKKQLSGDLNTIEDASLVIEKFLAV